MTKSKRGVNDITEFLEVAHIVNLVKNAKTIPYILDTETKTRRDRALLSCLALTGLRVSEVLSIDVNQFEDTPKTVWIKNVKILKRRAEHITRPFALPKQGIFSDLSMLILEHKDTIKKGKLFDINRASAWRIITYMTGFWCHYFRSQRISHLVNKFRSTVMVADFQGIKAPATISHYYKGDTRRHEQELSEA